MTASSNHLKPAYKSVSWKYCLSDNYPRRCRVPDHIMCDGEWFSIVPGSILIYVGYAWMVHPDLPLIAKTVLPHHWFTTHFIRPSERGRSRVHSVGGRMEFSRHPERGRHEFCPSLAMVFWCAFIWRKIRLTYRIH